mmetsp:Transcript_63793/g.177379  ORF Transcript_63793/g.177379 Transcript_63793/m.177379 type:complete len:227 (-) Transcript_63793:8-688(-)
MGVRYHKSPFDQLSTVPSLTSSPSMFSPNKHILTFKRFGSMVTSYTSEVSWCAKRKTCPLTVPTSPHMSHHWPSSKLPTSNQSLVVRASPSGDGFGAEESGSISSHSFNTSDSECSKWILFRRFRAALGTTALPALSANGQSPRSACIAVEANAVCSTSHMSCQGDLALDPFSMNGSPKSSLKKCGIQRAKSSSQRSAFGCTSGGGAYAGDRFAAAFLLGGGGGGG